VTLLDAVSHVPLSYNDTASSELVEYMVVASLRLGSKVNSRSTSFELRHKIWYATLFWGCSL